jgi:hypothetical protein
VLSLQEVIPFDAGHMASSLVEPKREFKAMSIGTHQELGRSPIIARVAGALVNGCGRNVTVVHSLASQPVLPVAARTKR